MKSIILFTLAALFLPIIALAETPPSLPLLVYGNATIDGAPAGGGTVISAEFDGRTVARTTITAVGKYLIQIPPENAGRTLTYKVGELVAAQKICPNPLITPSEKLDLAAVNPAAPDQPSAPAPGPTPTPPPAASSGGGGTTHAPPASNQTAPAASAAPALTPAVPSIPPVPQVLGEKISAAQIQLNNILSDSAAIWSEDLDIILANSGGAADKTKEKNTADKYISKLSGHKNLTPAEINRLNFFISYSTATTKILGAGERAGVINSYQAAFGKLPKTEADWQDALKIANGRWPAERSAAAEAAAKAWFKKIYGREANMENQNENAAVTVMAYGLRPGARDLNSEKAAILAFKHFIKRLPASAVDWDIVRAIAYSGAKR